MTFQSRVPWPEEIRLFNALLRDDFITFLQKVFRMLNPDQHLDPNWHHFAMAQCLREVLEGDCKRLNINLPPRNLKSIMISVALPAFILGRNPAKRIICASYAKDLAEDFSRQCRAVMQSAWYRRAFPNAVISEEHNTGSDFMTTRRGGRFATSVGGMLTGRGADFIILDDVMKADGAFSDTVRKSVIEWYTGTVVTRLNDKQKGVIINVAQRLHPDDLTGHFIEQGGWKTLSLPAIAPEAMDIVLLGGALHRRKEGDILHPEREPKETLDRLLAEMGSAAFEAQYQQNPLPADGEIIKWDWFRTYGYQEFAGGVPGQMVQSWDTAGTDRSTSDWSVCTTWFVVGERYYLVDVFRERLRYPDLKRKIAALAAQHGAIKVLIENKGTGQSLIQDLHDHGRVFPIAVNPNGDKKGRLSACTALIELGRVFLPQQAPWLGAFKAELLRFPNGSHDDQVDSLSQFLGYMRDQARPSMFSRSF